ncbi:hypothetical protein ACLKMH_24000 [Psychromonas sp. KJ10-10]|uniref:hypothetical protein n=1 Tax=Psychromonas sp. KJ10-10 TaxID=3391823 RepID=UPI0039B65229
MKLYQTAKDTQLALSLSELPSMQEDYQTLDTTVYTDAGEPHRIYMDSNKTFQEWEGFGGAFTESAAGCT